ncbi:MAG TPA: S-methyl-5-thioribose-1-phosphate isomerase [Candidatus Limnocylindrales bacterium]|nr:S-methyl-5-thioribose-1-phosphate isomerase [Candidatus Limnocylindrales bacterium]
MAPDPGREEREPAPEGSEAGPTTAPPTADPTLEGADLARRRFFRSFASDVFSAAATVVGTAQALQRTSTETARALLGGEGDEPPVVGSAPRVAVAVAGVRPSGFRPAFRWDGPRLYLVDQRRLPDELLEHLVEGAADAVVAMRDLVVRGAPVLGQVAAISLALTAGRLRGAQPFARRAMIRGSASGLRDARPAVASLGWAIDRMLARFEAVGSLLEDGNVVADALWTEAEAIVYEATDAHGRLAEHGLAVLPNRVAPDEGGTSRPLQVLTHGTSGALAGGQFGTALAVVVAAHDAGREIHAWVDETRPGFDGTRISAWELEQAGVPHTVIPDSAAASLIAAGRVDAIVVGADRAAANGDTAATIGTYPLALVAARHGIPFYVCAPRPAFDLTVADAAGLPLEHRSALDLTRFGDATIAPPSTPALNPVVDVTPAELITAFVTDVGILAPPFTRSIAAAFAEDG